MNRLNIAFTAVAALLAMSFTMVSRYHTTISRHSNSQVYNGCFQAIEVFIPPLLTRDFIAADAPPYPGWNLLTDCEYEFVSYLPQLDCDDREVVLDVDGAVVVNEDLVPQCSSSTVFCCFWVIGNRVKGVFYGEATLAE